MRLALLLCSFSIFSSFAQQINKKAIKDYYVLTGHELGNLSPYYNGKHFIIGNYDVFPHNALNGVITEFSVNNGRGIFAPYIKTNTEWLTRTVYVTIQEVSEYSEWSDWTFDVEEGGSSRYGIDGTPFSIDVSGKIKGIGTIRNDVATALAQDNPLLHSDGQPCRMIGNDCVYQYSNEGYQAARDLLDQCRSLTAAQGHCMNLRIPQSNGWAEVSRTDKRVVERRRVIVGVRSCGKVIWGIQYREQNLETGEIITERIVPIEEEYSVTTEERKKAQIELSLAPIFFFDYQNNNFIQNTALQDNEQKVATATGQMSLEPSQDEDIFAVTIRRKVDAGLGVSVNARVIRGNGTPAKIQPFAGLALLKGSTVESTRLVEGLENARKSKRIKIPKDLDSASKLKIGESVSFESSGGVLGLVGFNFFGIGAGANYIAQGKWKNTVRKTGKKTVTIERVNTDLRVFGLPLSGLVASVAKQWIKEDQKNLVYQFDVTQDEAQQAYSDFIDGDMTLAQSLAIPSLNKKSTAVKRLLKGQGRTKGKIRSVGVGIPYINWSTGRGKIKSTSSVQYDVDGSKLETETAMFVKTRDSRFFNKSENLAQAMIASENSLTTISPDLKKETASDYQGQLVFSYKDNQTKKREFDRVLTKLYEMTGLSEVLVDISEKNLNDVSVVFNLKLNKLSTNYLMATIQNPQTRQTINQVALGFMESYFKALESGSSDKLNLCKYQKGFDECRDLYNERTKVISERVTRIMAQMSKLKLAKVRKEFLKTYVKLGREMMKNVFVFQAILNLTKGRGSEIDYVISGSNFRKRSLTLRWKPVFIENK